VLHLLVHAERQAGDRPSQHCTECKRNVIRVRGWDGPLDHAEVIVELRPLCACV
jgi:hypothetical protein